MSMSLASRAACERIAMTTFISFIPDKPRDLKIFPQQSSFFVGEELMCSSNANPGAVYEWKDLETGHVVQGAVFKLEEYMTNKDTTYLLCNATNDISYATLSVNVTVSVKSKLHYL